MTPGPKAAATEGEVKGSPAKHRGRPRLAQAFSRVLTAHIPQHHTEKPPIPLSSLNGQCGGLVYPSLQILLSAFFCLPPCAAGSGLATSHFDSWSGMKGLLSLERGLFHTEPPLTGKTPRLASGGHNGLAPGQRGWPCTGTRFYQVFTLSAPFWHGVLGELNPSVLVGPIVIL